MMNNNGVSKPATSVCAANFSVGPILAGDGGFDLPSNTWLARVRATGPAKAKPTILEVGTEATAEGKLA